MPCLTLPRYKGYNPLYAPGSSVTRTSIRWVVILLVLSVIVNVILLWGKVFSTPFVAPLDDYQNLNTFPSIVDTPQSANQSTAIVTTLYSDAYAPAVATLGRSLRAVNTTARLLVLYFPDAISPAALCLATSSGFTPHPVARIAPPHGTAGMNPNFVDQFTKLALWTLGPDSPTDVEADTVVYMDADTLALRNFDELFHLPYAFAAVPDVMDRGFIVEFNAGVLLLRPSARVYDAMRTALLTARFAPEYAEQAFLNQWFAVSALRLPYVYNGNLAYKTRAPAVWAGMQNELRIVHYTIEKPFPRHSTREADWGRMSEHVEEAARKKGGLFAEEMRAWGRMWAETYIAYEQMRHTCRA